MAAKSEQSGRLHSLRSSLLIAITSLLLGLILAYSIISVSLFIDGADTLNTNLLYEARDHYASQIDAGRDIHQPSAFHIRVETDFSALPDYVQAAVDHEDLQKNKLEVLRFDEPQSDGFEGVVFLLKDVTPGGRTIFLTRALQKSRVLKRTEKRMNSSIYQLVVIGGIAFVLCVIVLILLFRAVARPLRDLAAWAGNPDSQRLDEPMPNFHYQEIDHLACLLRDSLRVSQQAIEREHDFLRHASHELRTPLTIISGNLQLLRRFYPPEDELETTSFARLERATQHMSLLTETLLWLSRDESYPLPFEQINLQEKIGLLLDRHKELICQSDIEVSQQLAPCTLELPSTPTLIVLGNLIRNAYQHGAGGWMHIELDSNGCVTLTNSRMQEGDEISPQVTENFGLGLKLVEKLCQRFNWPLEQKVEGDCWLSRIYFAGDSNCTINSGLDGK